MVSKVGQTNETEDPTLLVISPMSSLGVLPCSAGVLFESVADPEKKNYGGGGALKNQN